MAKRAKGPKAAKRAKAPRAPQAEPFFRPFAKLEEQRRARAPAGGEAEAAPIPTAAKPSAQRGGPIPSRPAAGRAQRPVTRPADDDAPQPVDPQTFATYMAGVRSLPGSGANRIPRTASKLERAAGGDAGQADADADDDARARMRTLVTEGLRFETIDDGERIEGRRLDVDPRELRRLRRGQYAIDGKLDLHGLGADEARHAVEAFVRKRSQGGDRAVVIVHGKGTHSPRGHAVLRGEIAAWLSQGRSACHVAAFATAHDDAPDERGAGAVFVLLAR